MNRRRVLFISKGARDAATRYRSLAYFDLLQQNGWEPVHLSGNVGWRGRLQLLRSAAESDVVVVQRKTFNPLFFRLLKKNCRRLVYDLDDAVFLRSDGSRSATRAARFARIAGGCCQVWAGNRYLAAYARRYNPSVRVLPTALAPEKYSVEAGRPADWVDLVWIGSRSTRRYLEPLANLLEGPVNGLPRLRLKIVADFDIPTRNLATWAVPWSEDGEATALASAHIGVAPMPDDPWTRGKCALKVIQYMAAGLPVISSPAGVNGEVVVDGRTGFLAQTPAQWRESIARLAADGDLRQDMGARGRRRVIDEFSIQATFPKMLSALEEILD
jgi:glycosyltransferase involved in cell wall biosynthesis